MPTSCRAWPGRRPTRRRRPDPVKPGVALAPLARAGLVLVVGRDDPVLRARERQWISTMAELADHCSRVLPPPG